MDTQSETGLAPTTEAKPPTGATEALPPAVARRGFNEAQWRTLCNNLYPGARSNSVLMVLDYCLSRKLDPMKKPCHIVPMQVKDVATNTTNWRDVVMPGIYEYRTTAHRTGLYLGHSKPEYGPMKKIAGVDAPEWCSMDFYRWHQPSGRTIEFPVTVFFDEVVAIGRENNANSRWSKAPTQMLTKCCEAAGLREAFPEEFGGEATAEEMDGRVIDSTAIEPSTNVVQMPARRSEQAAITGQTVTTAPASAQTSGPQPEPETKADVLPDHADRITELVERPTPSGKVFFEVKTERGTRCYTWSTTIMARLKTAKESKELVELATTQDAKGQHRIDSVQTFVPGGAK